MIDRRLFEEILASMSENLQQVEAINQKTHCVVLAGPGSGKTRTLTTAMARAVLEDVEEPRGIACITYNNECALELENRLKKFGIETGDNIFIGTVHSFALSQILLPYARCIYPEFTALPKIATKANINGAKESAYRQVFGIDRSAFNRAWTAAELKRRKYIDRTQPIWTTPNSRLLDLVQNYEAQLRRANLLDYDDMSLLAARAVREHQWVREALFAKFPILFVDEYQDLGTALHEIVLQLCFEAGARLFAVGDPDQSVYRFSGADPNLLKTLSERDDVHTVSLPFNYRCGTSIVDISNAALGEERGYVAPVGAHKGDVIFNPIDSDDLQLQANFVVQDLIPDLVKRGITYENIAILYRDAFIGNAIAEVVNDAGIPHIRADKNALIPRNNRLSRLLEAMACWVVDGWKNGDPTFSRLAKEAISFVYGSGASKVERQKLTLELISFLHNSIPRTGSTLQWLREVKEQLVTPWQQRARTVTDEWDVIDRIIERVDPVNGNGDISLALFSGRVEQTGRLNLSTFHSSKGREFEAVVLFGVSEGQIPNDRDAQDAEQLLETRRLFYVAVTRAKNELHLVFQKDHSSPWVLELYKRLQLAN